jgi:hypothetical protein
VVIKENLEWLFADNPHVFVAADLLWVSRGGKWQNSHGPRCDGGVWQTQRRSMGVDPDLI